VSYDPDQFYLVMYALIVAGAPACCTTTRSARATSAWPGVAKGLDR
jgi:hypothetical protein